ncbi:hypothetical protein KCU79_g240, partial [Aureobasidium melanogenum]
MDPSHIIDYFQAHVDATYLGILQQNKATIIINMMFHNPHTYKFDMSDFYTWALFLIATNLETTYCADRATWMEISAASDRDFDALCVIEQDTRQAVRDNIHEIRERAKDFDRDLWRAYPAFRLELQAPQTPGMGRETSRGSLELWSVRGGDVDHTTEWMQD